METITVQISSADKAMLERIAKSVDRRPADFYQLVFSKGLSFIFIEDDVWVHKLPDDYTEQERQQQEKNKAIRENPEIIGSKAEREAGYVEVSDSISNHERKPDGDGFYDPLVEPIAQRVRAVVTA